MNKAKLRAYLDGELTDGDADRVQVHLDACGVCAREAHALRDRADLVAETLSVLRPATREAPPHVAAARARLQPLINEREGVPMQERIFSRRYRPAWAGLATVVALAVALAFPSVRVIATDFLGLFRVQRIEVVEVNPANLPEFNRQSTQVEKLMSESMQVEERGEPREVADAAEASAAAGIPVRLPTAVDGELHNLTYQPGAQVTFEIDLQTTRALLDEIGRSDIALSDQIDGATVTVDLPDSVTAAYGQCNYGEVGAGDPDDPDDAAAQPYLGDPDEPCSALVQMRAPTISAPPGVPISQLGEAWLQLMGLSEEDARQYSSTVDWSTTLVIPLPTRGATVEDVNVDGVPGTLVTRERAFGGEYLLLWVKDEIVYGLTGYGDGDTALSIANSLE